MSKDKKCSTKLLYAILIYENMNRFEWIRSLERFIVKLTGWTMTIGIAQVKTNRPISDEDSIEKAAEILEESQGIESRPEDLYEILRPYNDSKLYAREINSIIEVLKL